MKLRNYQQDAVDATLKHFRRSDKAAVIVLPTGAGKSLVIAELARLARFPIIVLAHVKELVEQNHAKFVQLGLSQQGLKAGVFAAGLGKKQSQFQVTFASIQSITRNLSAFDGYYSLLIVDECHRVSLDQDSQYQQLITHLSITNPRLKVLGLTATPYRLDKGWIYQKHYHGFYRSESEKMFERCIFELPLRRLIKDGFLTEPKVIDAPAARYQFDELPIQFQNAQLEQFLSRYARITQAICAQIKSLAEDRQAVMIFAASVKHAQEIQSYFEPKQCALITAETPMLERDQLIQAFKNKELKFLVNVSVLTTGFDAPHVDMIAILRRTDSVSLYQQIVGRGLRLADNKSDCWVIDYAGNGYDLYQPEVGELKPNAQSDLVQVPCPQCDFANLFWGIVDSNGHIIEHYGRRCQGEVEQQQCDYRFKYKVCPNCDGQNDIAARECTHCGTALVDADKMLKQALALKDRKVLRCSGMSASVSGNKLRLVYYDEDGAELSESFNFEFANTHKKFEQLFFRTILGQAFSYKEPLVIADKIDQLVAPDFVIARKQKYYWKIEHRIFDYKGSFRKANQL
ncbi:DEAD/DEAH box helicase [Alginatibacterium sediminis]|uniref:DEAD/DEAH box helicase n=1 Tax=Alginatibacterium sediminis TaxID=2164068 RepID=A0A420EGC2_9ALTE|nr:DEAD/DEAH box helicase [Alginatibacterium sediminis]RKF19727.1 DEAD/DEAH box helicase [Alginatibacterium sediminis]